MEVHGSEPRGGERSPQQPGERPGEEQVEVLGPSGEVVGVVGRAEMRARRLRHRCTFVVVRSGAGDVLVHRRSDDKDLWPGRWDLCVGGVVSAGEEWGDAALRELSEEVGIDAAAGDLVYLGERAYADDDVDELARIWTITHDGPFEFRDGEVVEAAMVTPAELDRMLRTRAFVADSAAIVAPMVTGS